MIPGDPDALDAAASQLEVAADLLAGSRNGVLRAAGGMEGWRGPASDAARAALHGCGQRPVIGVRVLEQAAPVLREYAAALRGAQIAVSRGQELVVEGVSASTPASGAGSARTAGESLAAEGDAMMTAALDQARMAEERAAARIRELAREAQAMRPGAGAGGSGPVVGPAGARPGPDPWLRTGTAGVAGPNAGAEATGPQGGKLAEAKLFADLVKAQAQGSAELADVRLSGKAEANLGVELAGSASATDEGLIAKAEASVGAKVKAEGRIDEGIRGIHGRAEGSAGAEAGIGAALTKDEIKAKAGAFAGAKGKLAAGADVGGIGAGVTAEGWAGPGVEADVNIGQGDDGKFRIGAGVGASPLIGGKVGWEITVDPAKVEKTYHEAADAVEDIGESAERGWNSSRGAISKALDDAF